MKLPISAIILTYNEELNIENCLQSIADWVDEIIVVDSMSRDKTLEIVKKYTDKVHQRRFVNQAEQFNWALDTVAIKNDWILRLDADEIMLPETWNEINEQFNKLTRETTGFYLKRRVYFMNRWIKHGGYYPAWFLRLWRRDAGRYEEREMDEHVILSSGKTINLQNDFEEHDRKNLSVWIEKHNKYATREAEAYLQTTEQQNNTTIKADRHGSDPEKKRWYKENFYYKLPPFLRALLYFKYRYFIRLGFLDGIPGLIWHTLQGFWYRFLVDSKIYELKKRTLNPKP
ncbi:MAG: glycosyltransferase family 2 protein [Candidatus Liptonbacteria bacterium]|nr:glycosyltransferase family 2 protein [Candidatus Liptonbacteria bacterium]